MTNIVFLGGLGEIGMNMTAIETSNDIIVIDCGISFADNNMSGVSYYAPDMTYLLLRKHKVRAIYLTHGHEDHIGNIKLFNRYFPDAHIYGSVFTMQLIKTKIPRRDNYSDFLHDNVSVKTGDFVVTPIHVNHSIPQAYAYHISTPDGTIIHSGDLKVDFWPINEKRTNLKAFKRLGEKGVDLLLLESTNAQNKGHSLSESIVVDSLDRIFDTYKMNRIIITLFSTNINRINNIINLSKRYRRNVYISGGYLRSNVQAGVKAGLIEYDSYSLLDDDGLYNYPDEEVVIITPGCQGEPGSNLYRIANTMEGCTCLSSNDIVIFSSSIIPGNEEQIRKIKEAILSCQAKIIDISDMQVHSTGHGCRSDLSMIINSVKPKYFTPIHGEKSHLTANIQLAQEMGVSPQNIYMPNNGYILEMDKGRVRESSCSFDNGLVYLDNNRELFKPQEFMSERQNIAANGLLIISIAVPSHISVPMSDDSSSFSIISEFIGGSFITDEYMKELKMAIRNIVMSNFDSCKSVDKMKRKVYDMLEDKFDIKRESLPIRIYIHGLRKRK